VAAASNDEFNPEKLLHFVETDEFVRRWTSLGLDAEIDLWDLQDIIMRSPKVGHVIPGTGGLRKLRFARRHNHIGKRGGMRVCYVLFPQHYIVLLVTAYGKNQKDDLSAAEKRRIRAFIAQIEALLDSRSSN
jgi:hypothetical protein